jgi:hypothetical protein
MMGAALLQMASCGEGSQEPIILQCDGVQIDLTNNQRSEGSILLKVGKGGNGETLLYYDFVEKRFTSPCSRNFECALIVKPDTIEEVGMMVGEDGNILLSRGTDINRRTGSIRSYSRLSGEADRVTFEGQCEKGQLPPEEPTRF